MCILGEPHSHWNHYSHSHDPRDLYPLIHPRGWTWHIYRQESKNQRSIFWGFEFRASVFFGYWLQLLYFLGLLNKRCILKCFICSTVFFWFQFYSPGASIIMGLHYCHIMLDFCEVNSVLRVFLGLCFRKVFFLGGGREGFLLVAKHFWGHSEMPNSADPCL